MTGGSSNPDSGPRGRMRSVGSSPSEIGTPDLDAWARMAGAGYLIIIVAGIFAEFFVRSSLIQPGDPGGTAQAIAAAEGFFRTGVAAELVMLVADVAVAGALYVVLRGVDSGLALLAAFFRLAHAAVVGVNLLATYLPLILIGPVGESSGLGPEALDGLVLLALELHGYGYTVGLVFFGVHCLLLGHLVRRSRMFPPVLGVLLMIAGAGYLVDGFAQTLLVDYPAYEGVFLMVVFLPAFVGEVSFCLWLLARGVSGTGRREAAPA